MKKLSVPARQRMQDAHDRHTSTAASFSALIRGAPLSSLMRFDRETGSSESGTSERLRSSILGLSNEGTGSEGVAAAVI